MIIGNWKLNHLKPKMLEVLEVLKKAQIELIVAPVATLLDAACACARGSKIQIAAQNVFYEPSGAFTGEWSVAHLQELGVSMAIIGHSERRLFFGETSENVAKKARACLEGSLVPVVCVGESLEERESGLTEKIISKQLEPVLTVLSPHQISRLIIAYEPIWAIGTGKNANPQEIQEIHGFLREKTHPDTKLLYGGSVKPENASVIFSVPDVGGALVGGASLEAASLLAICSSFKSPQHG